MENDGNYSHNIKFLGKFNITYHLRAEASAEHTIQVQDSVEQKSSTIYGTSTWTINRMSTLRGEAHAFYTENVDYYWITIENRNRLNSLTSVGLRALWQWDSMNSGTRKEYNIDYSTVLRGVILGANYKMIEERQGDVSHQLFLSARKSFQMKMRRLF